MKRVFGRVLLLTLLLGTTARPCGGPGGRPIDAPLLRPHEYVWWFTTGGADAFDPRPREEFRFLHPFAMADSARMQAVLVWAYRGGDFDIESQDTLPQWLPRLRTEDLDALVRRGDIAGAQRAAEQVVRSVLDLPASIGDRYAAQLRRAVEILEAGDILSNSARRETELAYSDSAPSRAMTRAPALREILEVRALARDSMAAWATAHPTSPRVPSLEFVGLQLAMKRGIPDGYASDIAKTFPDSTRRRLDDAHLAWLGRHPAHPLADLVRLSRVRLLHFAGQDSLAWNALLEIYPRRLPRVVSEMRYLVMTGNSVPSIDDPRLDDALRTALVSWASLAPAAWTSWWRYSERMGSPAMRASMQERLLNRLLENETGAQPIELPPAFPADANGPTRLYRELRMLALMHADSFSLALAQSETIPLDSTSAPVRANLLLRARRWSDALALPFIDPWAKRYLVRLLAPDSVLDHASRGSTSLLTNEARLALAHRARRAGGWMAGVSVGTLPAEKASLWRTAASMESDTSRAGTLRFARWLAARDGQLFLPRDKWWFRSLSWRLNVLSDTTDGRQYLRGAIEPAAEKEQIESLLLASEHFLALQAYARWLERAPSGPATRTVVREADRLYNGLVNYDPGNSEFWRDHLERVGVGPAIRRAGRRR
jgi:hypothetical protein